MSEFDAMDAVILGVSSDSIESHKAFADEKGFEFNLLADVDHAVRESYGAIELGGLIPGRVSYVIDRAGKIAGYCNSAIDMKLHAQRCLEILGKLQTG